LSLPKTIYLIRNRPPLVKPRTRISFRIARTSPRVRPQGLIFPVDAVIFGNKGTRVEMKTVLGYLCIFLILAANAWQSSDGLYAPQKPKGTVSNAGLMASSSGCTMPAILSSRERAPSQSVFRSSLCELPLVWSSVGPSSIWAVLRHGFLPSSGCDDPDSLFRRGCLLMI